MPAYRIVSIYDVNNVALRKLDKLYSCSIAIKHSLLIALLLSLLPPLEELEEMHILPLSITFHYYPIHVKEQEGSPTHQKRLHLSYEIWNLIVGVDGFEPPTLCL